MLAKILDVLFLPMRFLCSHEFVNRIGLRSLRDERYDRVIGFCRGRLLDVGCGDNRLVQKYGHGSIGVDVHDYGGGAVIVEDAAELPFEDGSFDTVAYVASLNHICRRREAVAEARRVLSERGRIVLTMLSPFVGAVRHKLARWDRDQIERGLKPGEAFGLSHGYVLSLMKSEGFELVGKKRIMAFLNSIYVFEKSDGTER
jgi:SAM-dependent methyltransferase